MIIATLSIQAVTKNRKEILKTLRSLLGPTQVMPGCLRCCFFQNMENKNEFCLLEIWESKTDMDRHIRSEQYRTILALMGMSSEPPEIKFNEISHTAGMELIERVRQAEAPVGILQ